jgi:hypothetical protein
MYAVLDSEGIDLACTTYLEAPPQFPLGVTGYSRRRKGTNFIYLAKSILAVCFVQFPQSHLAILTRIMDVSNGHISFLAATCMMLYGAYTHQLGHVRATLSLTA